MEIQGNCSAGKDLLRYLEVIKLTSESYQCGEWTQLNVYMHRTERKRERCIVSQQKILENKCMYKVN